MFFKAFLTIKILRSQSSERERLLIIWSWQSQWEWRRVRGWRQGPVHNSHWILHFNDHRMLSSPVQRVLAFSKIAILWRLLQHHTSDNNEKVVEHDIDVKGLSTTMCSLWASWTESLGKKRGPMRTFWVRLLDIIYFFCEILTPELLFCDSDDGEVDDEVVKGGFTPTLAETPCSAQVVEHPCCGLKVSQ